VRDGLPPGFERPGPLIIEAMDTTIVVPPGWRCRADARRSLTLETMS
jgi:N-methylhydantoinase A/oxoprolinase/acetone carboxylase beta subunit